MIFLEVLAKTCSVGQMWGKAQKLPWAGMAIGETIEQKG